MNVGKRLVGREEVIYTLQLRCGAVFWCCLIALSPLSSSAGGAYHIEGISAEDPLCIRSFKSTA